MKNKYKKFLVGITIFSMLFGVIGIVPQTQAADSLTAAKDTLSDSEISATGVTHTIQFTTNDAIAAGGTLSMIFPSGFVMPTATGDVNCSGLTASFATTTNPADTVICTSAGGIAATSTTITIDNATNPTAGSYAIEIQKHDGATLEERVEIRVFIISDVYMTARVDSLLTFTIVGLNSGETVNGVTCSATTTATTTPFGTLNDSVPVTVCQELRVATNASGGFTVTVEQLEELTSAGNDTINSFNNSPDGTGSTTPEAWDVPTGTVGADHTYGHMGLTSEDDNLVSIDFGVSDYIGFNSTDPVEVFYHTGVANGVASGAGVGFTQVAYTAEITALQEAGDYETYLTYIATPTY